jgi:hypothetical protein
LRGTPSKRRWLLSWGENQNYQLGRDTEDDSLTPQPVDLGPLVPLRVSAGCQHVALLCEAETAGEPGDGINDVSMTSGEGTPPARAAADVRDEETEVTNCDSSL